MNPMQEACERHVANLELRTPQWRQIVRNAFGAGAVAAMTLLPKPKKRAPTGTAKFLRRLSTEQGHIVCTNALTPEQVIEARETGRLFVMGDGIGFAIVSRGVEGGGRG